MNQHLLELTEAIQNKIRQRQENQVEVWPHKHNRASAIGHPCARWLWYVRADNPHEYWKTYLKPPSVTSIQFMEEGRWHEQRMISELMDLGFSLIHFDKTFSWERYNIEGKTDYRIKWNGGAPCVELKSTAYDIPDNLSELKGNLWFEKWRVQALCYPWLADEPEGLLIHKNRTTGAIKCLPFEVQDPENVELMEAALNRCEIVLAHLKTGKPPERMPFNCSICPECDFKVICDPVSGMIEAGAHIDPDLPAEVARWMELKPAAKEYEELDRAVKAKLKGVSACIVGGHWAVSGKEISVKGRTQEVKPYSYWKFNFKDIGEQTEGGGDE
jgi:hypothetical protein